MDSDQLKLAMPEEIVEKATGDARSEKVRAKAAKLRKIKPQDIGLKVLVQPAEADDIEVDIVAVHGIGANPGHTWVNRENSVNWLSDPTMLPNALPKARIMTFSYESYWFGENAIRQSLAGVATKLLRAFSEEREDCLHRPIIFIGHCFGGLVIQEAYITATLHKEDHAGISDSVVGMIFLGTPHHGIHGNSGLQTQGQIYEAIAAAKVQMEDNVLNTIAQDNDVLVNTVHNFTRSVTNLRNSAPKLFCFWEQKKCKIGRVAGIADIPPEFLVTESSGTLNGHENEALPLDHFAMNKFEDSKDTNYHSVRRQIQKMNKESKAIMKGRGLENPPIAPPWPSPRDHRPSIPAPIAREAHFAPRGDILGLIESKYGESMNVVLRGDSGNGKTHIAVEYAHKFHREHPGARVHWVNAGNAAQFELSYKRIAETLHISKERTRNANIVEVVYDTLEQDVGSQWLMVLDGLDDNAKLEVTDGSYTKTSLLDFVPKPVLARVLTTTQSKTMAMRLVKQNTKYVIDVPTLKDEDAAFLLLGEVTSDAAKKKRALEVTKELGSSAGTVTMAHLYHQIAQSSLKSYMEKVCLSPSSAKERTSTMRAWRLLYNLVKEKHTEAARLLLLIGSLDVQSIPTPFFERLELSEQIPILVQYGMVEPSADSRVLTVTDLVRRCVHTFVTEEEESNLIEEQALAVMCNKFKDEEYHTADVLLPCALSMLNFKPVSIESKRNLATLHSRVAGYYANWKRHRLAADHLERCLFLYQEDPQKNEVLIEETRQALHRERSNSELNANGDERKALVKAETLVDRIANRKRELLELEKSAGRDHPDTIRKTSDFATFQLMNGEKRGSEETIELYRRVLDWCKDKYGEDNIDTARRQYNLAIAFDDKGEYEKAAELYRSASGIVEQHLGPNSPELLRIIGNLACMHCKQGHLEEAQKAFRIVLLGQQKALGPDHPETLVTRQNIAMMLGDMGQVDAAVVELEKVMSVQVRLLGYDNPAALRTACSLAMNYGLRGSFEDAKKLYGETLEIQEKRLGETHRDTTMTRLMLAELLQQKKGTNT
ncbi:NAD-dependent isocitrate dehydrogenase [Hypoxylon texense]